MAVWAVTAPPGHNALGVMRDDDVSKMSILLMVPLLL